MTHIKDIQQNLVKKGLQSFDHLSHRDSIKKENLINEYKGLLFEYLVGEKLAQSFGILPQFYQTIPSHLREKLKDYQEHLIQIDLQLLRALPLWAEEAVNELKGVVPLQVSQILMVGNLFGAAHNESLSESDLYLLDDQGVGFPVSLKLCKWNSFVNTKNAGVQSLIEKYFLFPEAFSFQNELSNQVDESYLKLIEKILLLAPEFSQELQLIEKKGSGEELTLFFQKNWKRYYSHLPGELPESMREILFQYYSEIINKIYQIFLRFYEEDQDVFLKSLYPLLGFGSPDICQINCFHQKEKRLKGIHIISFEELREEVKHLVLEKPKENISSFNIILKSLILQIRVKPMNSFMVKSPKINCSVKHLLS